MLTVAQRVRAPECGSGGSPVRTRPVNLNFLEKYKKLKMNQIKPEDKVCYNCKHLLWMIGIGQGLRCGHPKERGDLKFPPIIPKRTHTCGLFETKELKESKNS